MSPCEGARLIRKKGFLLVPQDAILPFQSSPFPSRYLQPATFCSSFWASANLHSFWHCSSSKMPLLFSAFIIPFFSVCDWPHPLQSWLCGCWAERNKLDVTTAKATLKQMLFMVQLWLQKLQCYQQTFSPSLFQCITNISSVLWEKAKISWRDCSLSR